MIRWLAAAAATVAVNILLLLLMARLVEGGPARIGTESVPVLQVDLVELRREPPPPPEPRHRSPPPAPPEPPPPPPPAPSPPTRAPRAVLAAVPIPAMDLPLRLDEGPYIGTFVAEAPALETDVMPLVRIDPRYPRRALLARIEGRVVVALTITPDGAVADPRIVEAEPEGVFEDAVLRAVRRWKFAPKVVGGEAVARRALQTIRFALGGSGR